MSLWATKLQTYFQWIYFRAVIDAPSVIYPHILRKDQTLSLFKQSKSLYNENQTTETKLKVYTDSIDGFLMLICTKRIPAKWLVC